MGTVGLYGSGSEGSWSLVLSASEYKHLFSAWAGLGTFEGLLLTLKENPRTVLESKNLGLLV